MLRGEHPPNPLRLHTKPPARGNSQKRVIDKDGSIVYFHEGGNSYDTKEFVDMMEGVRK